MLARSRSIHGTLALISVALALTACGPKPPRRQIDAQGQSVASWAATGAMVAAAWLQGDVPAHYARQTLQSGAKQVERARSSLAQVAAGDSLAQVTVQAYGRLADRLTRMSDALQQGDRSALEQAIRQLPNEARRIRTLRERSGPGSPRAQTPSDSRAALAA